jgi:hypothetical protein
LQREPLNRIIAPEYTTVSPPLFEVCKSPDSAGKYDLALREAVLFVLDRFRPIGIVGTGRILRGHPDQE